MSSRTLTSLVLPALLLAGTTSYFFTKNSGQEVASDSASNPRREVPSKKANPLSQAIPSRSLHNGASGSNSDLSGAAFEAADNSSEKSSHLSAGSLPETEAEIANAFRTAIGPALINSLPTDQAEQIYKHFRNRIRQPSEPHTYLCWSEGTPMAVLEATHRAEDSIQNLIASGLSTQAFQSLGSGRWSTTTTDGYTGSYGTPITLTWSIAPDGSITDNGQPDDDNAPSNLIARLTTLYAAEGADTVRPLDEQPWFPYFVQIFEDLSRETGLIFVYEEADDGVPMSGSNDGSSGIRGDIRIFGKNIDGNSNVLAYNFSPGYGDMVIDTNDSFFENKGNNSRRLRNTLGHELGHGLGLGHVCPIDNTKLMEPYINLGFEGVQFDEVFSLQNRYGDHFERELGSEENNDTPAKASVLSPVAETPLIIDERLSIDSNSDTDVFQISANAGQLLSATSTPSSASYQEGATLPNGSCGGGTLFDSSSYHDLALEIIAPDGTTVLETANSHGAGDAESIVYPVTTAGTYYVRVSGDSSPETQIYSLSALLETPSISLTLTSSDLTTDEANASDTATLYVNSSEPPAEDITVTLVASGSASTGDYSGNLTATIPSGESVSNAVIITAVPDSDFEGTENLILTLPNDSSGEALYFPESPSTQTVQITDSPAASIVFQSSSIIQESFSQQNGSPDPDETLVLEVSLENIGTGASSALTANLTGPAGFLPFVSEAVYDEITPSSSQTQEFTFALSGNCGDFLDLSLDVSSANGFSASYPLNFRLGTISPNQIEDFENAGALPAGWSSTVAGDGSNWVASSAESASGSFSAFAANADTQGSSFLVSPSFDVPQDDSTVSFNHSYNTEANYDGAALEISIDEGPWLDIVDAGGSFTTGGYNMTLQPSSNYLSGRESWSGNSGGFVTTSLTLPPSATGNSVRLRWIMASDEIFAWEGWYIDDVSLPSPLECDTTGPALTFSVSGTQLSEQDASQTIELTVSSDPLLPSAKAIDISFESIGSAELADVSGLDSVSIPLGSAAVSKTICAVLDTHIEGTEILSLRLPGTLLATDIDIADTNYATWAFALGPSGDLLSHQDFDGDGSLNIEEFAFGTIGGDPQSKPAIQPVQTGSTIKVPAPSEPLPEGLTVVLETSVNMKDWSSDNVTATPGYFEFPFGGAQIFYRFSYLSGP